MSEIKKTGNPSREMHLVSSIPIDAAADCLKLLQDKRIDVQLERAAPDQYYFRLREHEKSHSVYIKLIRWNDTQTRVECALNNPFWAGMVWRILPLIIIGGIVAAVVEFSIRHTIYYSFFFVGWLCAMMYLFIRPIGIGMGRISSEPHEEFTRAQAQRSRSRILDTVIEALKSRGELYLL